MSNLIDFLVGAVAMVGALVVLVFLYSILYHEVENRKSKQKEEKPQ